jgi:hypothetical protein
LILRLQTRALIESWKVVSLGDGGLPERRLT